MTSCKMCWPGNVVGIATGYGMDGPGIESRWGARFSVPVQTGPGAHPASCTTDNGSFPGVKSGRGVTLTPHPRGHERVDLYLYSPYGPYGFYRASVPVQRCTLSCKICSIHTRSIQLLEDGRIQWPKHVTAVKNKQPAVKLLTERQLG
jgi:hypothetical protein